MTNATKATRPFFAVRVVLTYADGSTVERDYVRGANRLSTSDFAAFALGHLVALTDAQACQWTVSEIQANEVH